MEVVLGKVEFETLQAIADAAYANFMDDLKSSGIEVVSMETIAASASFQKMKMTGSTAEKPYTKRSRDRKIDYIVVSPSAIPLWFTNWDGDVSDQGMNQTNIRAIMSMSKELDALMLYPIMHVDFATVDQAANSRAAHRCPPRLRSTRIPRTRSSTSRTKKAARSRE